MAWVIFIGLLPVLTGSPPYNPHPNDLVVKTIHSCTKPANGSKADNGYSCSGSYVNTSGDHCPENASLQFPEVKYCHDNDGDGYPLYQKPTMTCAEAVGSPASALCQKPEDCDDTNANITIPKVYVNDFDGDGVPDSVELTLPGIPAATLIAIANDPNVYPKRRGSGAKIVLEGPITLLMNPDERLLWNLGLARAKSLLLETYIRTAEIVPTGETNGIPAPTLILTLVAAFAMFGAVTPAHVWEPNPKEHPHAKATMSKKAYKQKQQRQKMQLAPLAMKYPVIELMTPVFGVSMITSPTNDYEGNCGKLYYANGKLEITGQIYVDFWTIRTKVSSWLTEGSKAERDIATIKKLANTILHEILHTHICSNKKASNNAFDKSGELEHMFIYGITGEVADYPCD